MLLLFVGARLFVHQTSPDQPFRLPEFRLPANILDLEDFETAFYDKAQAICQAKLSLSRYLLLAHCTFMADNFIDTTSDGAGTSSRTLHVFIARALNADDLVVGKAALDNVKLLKPSELLDSLQAEWADVKTQMSSGGTLGDLRAEYDKSWTFVRLRAVAIAFQSLYDWPLPEI